MANQAKLTGTAIIEEAYCARDKSAAMVAMQEAEFLMMRLEWQSDIWCGQWYESTSNNLQEDCKWYTAELLEVHANFQ